ncbi:MAG: response regulator [Burkholderiales bacterium]|nr:response regulator [Burkholderiales bacterium]
MAGGGGPCGGECTRCLVCPEATGGRASGRKRNTDVQQEAQPPIRVLVIDDSNTIRRSAELYLSQAGCEVILAEDGFDALVKIADHEPHIVFVDIMMPRLDGYQTCELIKRHPKFASTPVIMLSSKDGLFDRARGRLAGSDLYITKPFTRDGLIKAVYDHVRVRV